MSKKPKHKVKLPRDRNGVPVGAWVVNIETDYYGNPQGSKMIRKAVKR